MDLTLEHLQLRRQRQRSQSEISNDPVSLSTLPKLPNEILDIIFRHLSFLDLVRCRAASQNWSQAMQSCSILRSRLFLSQETPSAPPPYRRERLRMDISMVAGRCHGGYYLRWKSFIHGPAARLPEGRRPFHPIINDLRHFMHILHPSFNDNGQFLTYLPFRDLDDLKQKTVRCNDRGSWADMFVTTFPIERLEVGFNWTQYPRCPWIMTWDSHTVEVVHRRGGVNSVLVEDFVEMCRRVLESLHEYLREDFVEEGAPRVWFLNRWVRRHSDGAAGAH